MSDKYFAIGSVGTFQPNDEVVGLDDERLAELVELGKVRVEQGEDDEIKPINKMKFDELQDYITANGGQLGGDELKVDLITLAQEIEDKLNDNQE